METLDNYLSVSKLVEPWERGMLLSEVLHSIGETRESYLEWLNGETDEDTVFSGFNIKRFVQYASKRDKLEEGYYWFKEEKSSEWEIGYLDDEGDIFTGFDSGHRIEDVYLVDLNPIVRSEDEEA